jgi:hypothetical protein
VTDHEVTTSTEYGTLNSATLVSSYVPITPSTTDDTLGENIELYTSTNNSSVLNENENSKFTFSYEIDCKYESPLRNNDEQIIVQETKNINATSLNYLEIEPSTDYNM